MTLGRAQTLVGGGLDRRFWRLWSASAVSNVADGILQIAIPLLAVSLTTSPALVGGVMVASRLPWLLFALVAGALTDRLDRRVTMAAVQLGRVVLVGGLVLAIVLGVASIPLLYVVVFVLGMLETLFDTSAQAILPNIVPRDRLSTANGRLFAVEMVMGQFVGPPLGGLLVALALASAFGATAVGYLGAALAIVSLRGAFRAERSVERRSIAADIRDGLVYLYRHTLLRTLAVVIGLINLANAAFSAIFVLHAVSPGPMELSAVGFGVLITIGGAGALAGTFVAPVVERRLGKANILALGILAQALQYAVLALSTNVVLLAAVMAFSNCVLIVFNVVYVSFRQRMVPDALMGRVIASFRLLSWGTLPVGALLGGLIGEAAGLPVVFAACAAISLVLLPARLFVTEARLDAAERAAEGNRSAEAAQ